MHSRILLSLSTSLALLAVVAATGGCGASVEPATPDQAAASKAPSDVAPATAASRTADSFAPRTLPSGSRAGAAPDKALQPQAGDFPSLTFDPSDTTRESGEGVGTPTLADVLSDGMLDERGKLKQNFPPPPEVDPDRAQAAGLRILEGQHLRLITDLPSSPEIDSLPALFDDATPLWADYLHIPPQAYADWKVQAYLMDREEPFRALDLFGEQLPDVKHGYQRGLEFWCRRQEELGYFQRHLFLHEGVHAFMSYCLGGIGPPWYGEGMAELLATHRIENGVLKLPAMPRNRDEVPLWGRSKVLRDAWAAGKAKMPEEILSFSGTAHRETEAYAWSWALCSFLSEHPASKEAFARMSSRADDFAGDFTNRLREELQEAWPDLEEDWMLLAAEMDYGYDVAANVPVRREATPLDAPRTIALATDAGWQSTGAVLEAGKTYKLEARGSASVSLGATPADFGPAGMTLWYFSGRPYGEIQVAVVDDGNRSAEQPSPLLRPRAIGDSATFAPERGGTLYLRTNLPSSLRDRTQGEFAVELSPAE